MRWLITGAEGFIGSRLVSSILETENDAEVFGFVWSESPMADRPPDHSRLRICAGDITDAADIDATLARARPEVILHLAAASSVAGSWQTPHDVYRTNVMGQLNLLEAARKLQPAPRVVVASSCQIYDAGNGAAAILREDTPLGPTSPYAVTKATQDLQAAQYWKAFALPTIRLRLFNHTGPGRPPQFVASSFAHQIAEIEHGTKQPVMKVGNLDVSRDFSDVRDVVKAWRAAALEGSSGAAYNVCSGQAVSIRTILDTLLDYSSAKIHIETNPSLLRHGEINSLCGDPAAIKRATGWTAEIPLEQTLHDLLDWWRDRVGS